MNDSDFDYLLPPERVAQEPAERRDAARLMVVDRAAGTTSDTTVARLGEHLRPGDLLVLNDTRVLQARLLARKPSGGRVEILLVRREADDADGPVWSGMVSTGRGLRPGVRLVVAPGFEVEVLGPIAGGRVPLRLRTGPVPAGEALRRHGRTPLPPYIRRSEGDRREAIDRERYQTVYAAADGAIAAPTAGLHFTPELLRSLAAAGVGVATLTLHVGPGTFVPLRPGPVAAHGLEPEAFRLPAETAAAIASCRARGGRVVAVGTTVTRVLEDRAAPGGGVRAGEGRCGLLIAPGHRFRVVDALLTNFHLPRTSLLVLVAAFAGRERILAAYREAVERGFRFYSYGDAMLIV